MFLYCIVFVVVTGNGTKSGTDIPRDVIGLSKLEGCSLLYRQFCTLFDKRYHCVRRSKKAFFSQVS